jgi:metallo-beta-lactamase family protein
MKITFLGAAGTVTGSKYLIEYHEFKVLVDCGLFQGLKELRLRNWDKFPLVASEINAVVLTHAHIDHSGYLPILMKRGFKGPIFSTPGTRDLCSILLPDAGKLQEEEASYANRKGYSKHSPALPLFTYEDGQKVLDQFVLVDFGAEKILRQNLKFCFFHSGHILGAASVLLTSEKTSIAFSGDLGRPNDLVMKAPEFIHRAKYLVIESTYGDEIHTEEDPLDSFEKAINRCFARQGLVIIPAFSVGRTQSIIYALYKLRKQKRIPDIPIFLNSPMSIHATDIYKKHLDELKITQQESTEMSSIVEYSLSVEDSVALNKSQSPKIIISASGMATGGRVLHHIRKFAPDSRNMLILCGYQAVGTRGDSLLKHAKNIKMFGEYVPINAEVVEVLSLSAHADQKEVLQWLSHFEENPSLVFLTHGESLSAQGLESKIKEELKWPTRIPHYLESFELK